MATLNRDYLLRIPDFKGGKLNPLIKKETQKLIAVSAVTLTTPNNLAKIKPNNTTNDDAKN